MAKRRAKRKNPFSTDPGDRSKGAGEYWFDADEAKSVVRFIEKRCHHWQGEWAGKPFILEPWELEIVEDIIGWKRKDGRRRYRTVSIWVPKGNGKTMLLGALALVFTVWDAEPGAEIFSAAGDRTQAGLIYNDAQGIVGQDESLDDRLDIFPGSKRIVDPVNHSFYQVLSSDSKTKHGFKPHAILFDELHVQTKRDLFDTLKSGMMKRRQPMLITISTAGIADESALCWKEYQYAKAVIEGEIKNPHHYAVIYEAPSDADPGSPKVWRQANPNYGVSVDVAGLLDLYEKAKHDPGELASFKRLHLNIWSDTAVGGIDMDKWRACGDFPETTIREECYLGLDVSSKLDLTALVALFPRTGSVLAWFWIPEENMVERCRREIFDYPTHTKSGLITATPGSWVDQGFIRNKVRELDQLFDIKQIAYDSWNASQLATWLQDEDGHEVVELRQGPFTLSEACKFTVGMILDGKFRHGNNPVLTWNARNLGFSRDSHDGWAPRKEKTGTKRIDGMVALIMAVRQAYVAVDDTIRPTLYTPGADDEDEEKTGTEDRPDGHGIYS